MVPSAASVDRDSSLAGTRPAAQSATGPDSGQNASGAAARVLSHLFGDNTAITVTNDALPGQSRSFGSFSAALAEIVDARVFGGIHFRTDCEAGQALGESVGEYVIKYSLRPIDGWDRRDDGGGDWGH